MSILFHRSSKTLEGSTGTGAVPQIGQRASAKPRAVGEVLVRPWLEQLGQLAWGWRWFSTAEVWTLVSGQIARNL